MKFILFVILILIIVALVCLAYRRGKIEIVSHAALLPKTWSVWLASTGAALGAWVQSFPTSALNAWGTLPGDVKSSLPQHCLGLVASFMVAMAVLAQFIRQKKLLAQKKVPEKQAEEQQA